MSDLEYKNIWPQERDVMARPERWRYVRKLIRPSSCVFCSALKMGVSFESLVVYETEISVVVLNKFPYNSGHTLVLPKKHCGELFQLSEAEYLDLSVLLRKTAKAIEAVYECQGLNIGLNHGKVAGAGIPDHLHWHIIPRWPGDTNFFPLIAETKVVPESLEQTYEKLRDYFDKESA